MTGKKHSDETKNKNVKNSQRQTFEQKNVTS